MKMNIRLIGLSLVFCCFVLVGCSQEQLGDQAITATVDVSTETPTVIETPAPTLTATLTQTPTPIVVSTVTPTAEKIVPEKYQEYIGKVYPVDVPELSGGGVLLDSGYSLTVASIGDEVLVILKRDITPHRTRNHEWEILDILVVPAGNSDEIFMFASCYKDDVLMPEIVGVAFLDDEAFIRRWVTNEGIRSLWRINWELERFEVVLDLSGYECSPESSVRIGPSSRTPMPEYIP